MEVEHPQLAPPPPSQVNCVVSATAVAAEFVVYLLWASSPPAPTVGVKPYFWGIALVVGLFHAFQGFRLAQSWRGRLTAVFLGGVHLLSVLLLLFMIFATGMRP